MLIYTYYLYEMLEDKPIRIEENSLHNNASYEVQLQVCLIIIINNNNMRSSEDPLQLYFSVLCYSKFGSLFLYLCTDFYIEEFILVFCIHPHQ
jgi:hypothetical protein